MKKCAKCKINDRMNDKNAYCRPCKNIVDLASYHKNKEKRLKYNKEYLNKNKEKISKWPSSLKETKKNYMKVWRKENKEYCIVYSSLYNKKPNNILRRNKNDKIKYKNDINYKMKCLLRCRFGELLTRNNTYKNNSILKLLGCSLEYFKQYIEQQFLPEMSWDNWGSVWELDHKKACSLFDLSKEEEQKICFHFSNQQPLFKTTEIAESFGYIGYIGNRNKYNK